MALRTKWHRADARRSDTRTGGSASSWRDHVTEEALFRILNMAPNISLGGRTAPAEDRFAGQLMYETQGQPPDTPNFVRHWGESAFRDGEDDGIGAFHWLDEGFGHAWRHADRALLFRAGGDRQPASTVLSNRPDSNARRPGSSCPQLTRRATLRRPG